MRSFGSIIHYPDLLLFIHILCMYVLWRVHVYVRYMCMYVCMYINEPLQLYLLSVLWVLFSVVMSPAAVLVHHTGSMARTLWKSCAQRTTSTVWSARRGRLGTSDSGSGQEGPLQVCAYMYIYRGEGLYFLPHWVDTYMHIYVVPALKRWLTRYVLPTGYYTAR